MNNRFDLFLSEAKKNDLKIVVISTKNADGSKGYFYTASRIAEVCKKRNIPSYVCFAEGAYLDDKMYLHNMDDKKGFQISPVDTAIVTRGSVQRNKANMNLITKLEQKGFYCINSRLCMEECSDKYRTFIKLTENGIVCPKTAILSDMNSIEPALKTVGKNFPLVVKTITGSFGIGVFIVDRIESLKSTLQAFWKVDNKLEFILQEFLDAKFDIRIHVLGGEVMAAMKRFKIKNDFRSNFSLGGKVGTIKLTDEQKEIAIKAAKSVNAIWCGVDMMIDKDGHSYVIEVNSAPGTVGIEKATGLSIADLIVDYIQNSIDLRDVNSTQSGYIEKVDIELLGKMDAKMDTGNGGYCVIHADNWEIKNKYVEWEHNGKKYEHKLVEVKDVKLGGERTGYEERPVIELGVKFNDQDFGKLKFTLSNREDMSTPVLMNREFIGMANLVVYPDKKFVLTSEGKVNSLRNIIGGKVI